VYGVLYCVNISLATTDWVLAPIYIYNNLWEVFLKTVRAIVLAVCNTPTEPAVSTFARCSGWGRPNKIESSEVKRGPTH